jgi:hypothetical protein
MTIQGDQDARPERHREATETSRPSSERHRSGSIGGHSGTIAARMPAAEAPSGGLAEFSCETSEALAHRAGSGRGRASKLGPDGFEQGFRSDRLVDEGHLRAIDALPLEGVGRIA